jgi:LysM repeat protein
LTAIVPGQTTALPHLKERVKMKKATRILIVAALLVAVLVLSGCNLSASKAPVQNATEPSDLLFLTETPVGDSVLNEIATQTAQAAAPAVATETPVPDEGGGVMATSAPAQQEAQPQQQQESKPVSVPTLSRPESYTLQKGEWPICIARRYNLNVGSLLSANGMTMASKPGAGTTMKIPSSGTFEGERALRAHTDYTVKSGDTVYTIACYFGDVSPEAIMAVNGLANPGDLKTGMTLDIP